MTTASSLSASLRAETGLALPALMRSCIPNWYHFGMTTQIAVRLPDEMVEFLDQLVNADLFVSWR